MMRQTLERVGGPVPEHNALDDAPTVRQAIRIMSLSVVLSARCARYRDVLLEVVGEPGVALGPRNQLDDHAASWAVDAPDGIAKPNPVRTHVEVAPVALAPVVNRPHTAHAA